MGAMASETTSFTIVYSTVYSGADKKNPSKLRVTGLYTVSGEFPAQIASNADFVFPFDDAIMKSHSDLPRNMQTIFVSLWMLEN